MALYFWISPLWGWINDKENSDSLVGIQTGINTSPGQTNSVDYLTADKENKNLRQSWKEVAKWINNDPRMHPAEPLTITRDPFRGLKEDVAKTAMEDQVEAKAPPVSPASLGMALTSTIIGPRVGIARIGGRTYNQGQTIDVEKDGRNHRFVLTEIFDRRVVLETEGERFELSIPEPGASAHMVLGSAEK